MLTRFTRHCYKSLTGAFRSYCLLYVFCLQADLLVFLQPSQSCLHYYLHYLTQNKSLHEFPDTIKKEIVCYNPFTKCYYAESEALWTPAGSTSIRLWGSNHFIVDLIIHTSAMLYQVIAYICPLKRISCPEALLSALPPSSTPQVDAPNAMISDSM